MMLTHSPSRGRRAAIGAGLVAALIGIYLMTYNGYAISRDEWFLFDATESLARRGDLRQNFQFDAYPPYTLDRVQPPPADTEPLQPALAALLFLAAQALPAVGLAHTVWLFNILITALTAGVLYAYGLLLGYRARTAVLVALVYGLGTIAWPYSRTFFREPLFTALALLSAYLIARVRLALAAGQRPRLALAACGMALIGMLLSKEAALLLLPALLIEALPDRPGQVRVTRRTLVGLAVVMALIGALSVGVLNIDRLSGISHRYAFAIRAQQARDNLSDMAEGVTGYLFSPARGLWTFSPVLVLGFVGWPRLIRMRRWRLLLMPLAVLVAFVIGYAVVRGETWYGGLGWGPRYLVPVTPFLALWLLPVAEMVFEPGTARWRRACAGAVLAASVGVQILAVAVPVRTYYATLAAQDPPIIPWQEGVWSLRWSPLWVAIEQLGRDKADLAWLHATGQQWWLPALAAVLGIAGLGWAIWWTRCPAGSRRALAITLGSLVALTALALGGGLYAIRLDPRYSGEFAPLRDLLGALEPHLECGDVVVLNDDLYSKFFMNYYKRARPTVYTLPPSPGERYSPEQPPQLESDHPDRLIHLSNTLILGDLARRHTRLWLVINSSPFILWSVRPVEHYLARHYFPLGEIKSTDIARAVLFDMTPAPPATTAAWPSHHTDALFGPDIRLVGYDIPGGTLRYPGDTLPVSLMWQALRPIADDYTVGLYVVSAQGQIVAQRDSFPVNGFEHTQTWRPGSLHRDNHALQLPADLAAGRYELWLALYRWQAPADRLPVTRADGTPLGDHALLAEIVVAP